MKRFINARLYGIIPGSKEDITEKLNNTLDILAKSGDWLVFEPGNYHIENTLFIPDGTGIRAMVMEISDKSVVMYSNSLVHSAVITKSGQSKGMGIIISGIVFDNVILSFVTIPNVYIFGNVFINAKTEYDEALITLKNTDNARIDGNFLLRGEAYSGGGISLVSDINTNVYRNYIGDLLNYKRAKAFIDDRLCNLDRFILRGNVLISIDPNTDYGHFNYGILSSRSSNLFIEENFLQGNEKSFLYNWHSGNYNAPRLASIAISNHLKVIIKKNYVHGWNVDEGKQFVIGAGETCALLANYFERVSVYASIETDAKPLQMLGTYIINNIFVNSVVGYYRFFHDPLNVPTINIFMLWGNVFFSNKQDIIRIHGDGISYPDNNPFLLVEKTNKYNQTGTDVKSEGFNTIKIDNAKNLLPSYISNSYNLTAIIPSPGNKVEYLLDSAGFRILTNIPYAIYLTLPNVEKHFYLNYDYDKKSVIISDTDENISLFSVFAPDRLQQSVHSDTPLSLYKNSVMFDMGFYLGYVKPSDVYPDGGLNEVNTDQVNRLYLSFKRNEDDTLSGYYPTSSEGFIGINDSSKPTRIITRRNNFNYSLNFYHRPEDSDKRKLQDKASPKIALLIQKDKVNMASGVFIAPNKILTAAHVGWVINFRGKDTWQVYSGYDSSDNKAKDLGIKSISMHPDYNNYLWSSMSCDLCVITTNDAAVSYYEISEIKDPIADKLCSWEGYPSDKSMPDPLSAFLTPALYYDSQIINYKSTLTNYNAATPFLSATGQSGSGLISKTGSDSGKVIGVLYGGLGFYDTIFVLLYKENYKFVIDNLK